MDVMMMRCGTGTNNKIDIYSRSQFSTIEFVYIVPNWIHLDTWKHIHKVQHVVHTVVWCRPKSVNERMNERWAKSSKPSHQIDVYLGSLTWRLCLIFVGVSHVEKHNIHMFWTVCSGLLECKPDRQEINELHVVCAREQRTNVHKVSLDFRCIKYTKN